MDIKQFYADPGEKPLDRLVADGGMVAIFRTLACIGDSLSSGEMESWVEGAPRPGYHDYYQYSWGQYIARMAGITVRNFSHGGMTAKQYMESSADKKNWWDPALASQGYIVALGVNDLHNENMALGSLDDVDFENWRNNKPTFAGYYCQILSRVREISPKSRIFLVTMPGCLNKEHNEKSRRHAELMHKIAEALPFTYVIDLYRDAPVYDEEFRRNFYMGGHLNAAGYWLTAKMIASYIDYIIRNRPEDFTQIAFVGTSYHNERYKW